MCTYKSQFFTEHSFFWWRSGVQDRSEGCSEFGFSGLFWVIISHLYPFVFCYSVKPLTLLALLFLVTVVATLPGNCWPSNTIKEKSIRLKDIRTNRFGGLNGVIQFFYNGTWSYINGSDWDYPDARVACKELGKEIALLNYLCLHDNHYRKCFHLIIGYKGVARLYTNATTFTVPPRSRRFSPLGILTTIVNGVKCIGDERDIGECIIEGATNLLLDQPMQGSATQTVDDVACVSCTGNLLSHDLEFVAVHLGVALHLNVAS